MNKEAGIRVLKEVGKLIVENKWGVLKFAETNRRKSDLENKAKIGDSVYQLMYITSLDVNYVRHLKALNANVRIIFIRDILTKQSAEQMIKANIYFIDTAGNAFIKNDRVHIEIIGKKKKYLENTVTVRQKMNPAAVKLIYLLLRDRNAINKPYRQLAQEAGISLGGITIVFDNLKRNNYIVELNGKRILTNTRRLFDKWVEGYLDNLNHKLILGNFRFNKTWKEFEKVNETGAKWGGEVAAYKMIGNIKPVEMIIYIEQDHYDELIKANNLLKDASGNVLLKDKFWNAEDEGDMADAFIVYADLIGSGNQRDEETAKLVYEKHIIEYLR